MREGHLGYLTLTFFQLIFFLVQLGHALFNAHNLPVDPVDVVENVLLVVFDDVIIVAWIGWGCGRDGFHL